MQLELKPSPVATARKKRLYLQLPFFGDETADRLIPRFDNSISHLPAATLTSCFNKMPLISKNTDSWSLYGDVFFPLQLFIKLRLLYNTTPLHEIQRVYTNMAR